MTDERHDYEYAILQVVPRVQVGDAVPVGVILHVRTANFIGILIDKNSRRWQHLCPDTLSEQAVLDHLSAIEKVAEGGEDAGPIGLLPPSERFHWLTAPRSAVLQTTEISSGRTDDPLRELTSLFEQVC